MNGRRGFALLSVMLIVALIALMGAVMLDSVRAEIVLSGYERSTEEARQAAEGGVMELIDDRDTPDMLPRISDSDLRATYNAGADSAFQAPRAQYTAEVQLL